MMHNVHFLTVANLNSKKGWVAPVELPADEPQDGVLVVPVSGQGFAFFHQYQLEYTIHRGVGKFDRGNATMDALTNGILRANIEGQGFRFVKHLVDGKPIVFEYIGELSHADFSGPLCQIEPEDARALDDLYAKKQIIVAGCEPESEYGGIAAFLNSSVGRNQFR